jgi:hypothetical protein
MLDKDTGDEYSSLRDEIKRLRKSLSELTPSLEVLLKRRGFKIFKQEPSDDLLLPEKEHIPGFYEMLKKYSFRLFLREVIKHQQFFKIEQVTRYATSEVTKDYVAYMKDVGLLENVSGDFRLAPEPVKSFGETLEWFVAKIFQEEFGAEAIWGIKSKRPNVGGDYDLIAKVDGSILYMEIKSSPPKQIHRNEITAFFDRVVDLHPEISIFLVDTELRMKDKIVLMFEDELRGRYADPPEIMRMEKELFQIWHKIFIINAKDSISNNLEKVLSWYYREIQ